MSEAQTTYVDPRIFEQIAELPEDEQQEELNALAKLADLGMVPIAVGERAKEILNDKKNEQTRSQMR